MIFRKRTNKLEMQWKLLNLVSKIFYSKSYLMVKY